MKSIVVSSNCSGGGKTTVSIGLMKVLKNRGYSVQGYKVGPDYIDTAFHTRITGQPSRNLDMHLMGEDGMRAAFSRGNADYGVVEGAMGLYDGSGIDSEGSAAHIAKSLGLPVVLVLSPYAQVATLCAEINGLVAFDNIHIVGVILNNINEGYYKLLKASIELNCSVKVLGYLPNDPQLVFSSRHLGLVQSQEIDDLEQRIDHCSRLMEQYMDIDGLVSTFQQTPAYADPYHLESRNLRTAVPLDEAFSFYYKENLELLSELGEIVYFSPLRDRQLPDNIDFLYIGGGYPEVFAQQLSENRSMLQSIHSALENGLRCYAECGGLMYLTSSIEGHAMVGFFKGPTTLTKRLQNFGYCSLNVADEKLQINAHEFHTSCVQLTDPTIYSIYKTLYNNEKAFWKDGYTRKNVLAGYPHVHFFGNLDFLEYITRA